MRPIDADALKQQIEFLQENTWAEDLSYKILSIIDSAETIDAIPVAWLEKWKQEPALQQTVHNVMLLWMKEQGAKQ